MTNCNSQNKNSSSRKKSPQNERIDREPAVAGRFYSSDPAELTATLKDLFSEAIPGTKSENAIAVIAPHAGYVFSGGVAATSFNQIDKEKEYSTIFIIGTSHQASFKGASIYSIGNYITPLGTVNVDIPLAEKLISENNCFNFHRDVHWYEHSIEVILPFLQYILKKDFKIVPVLLGTRSHDMCKKIASALLPYFTSQNLFIVSTDFSHYPLYNDALMVDKLTADAVVSNSSKKLISTLNSNNNMNIPNLQTSMCGWPGVLTLVYMTENKPGITVIPRQYKNSGDFNVGDKNRVVGYYSIIFLLNEKGNPKGKKYSSNSGQESFTENEKKELLRIARQTIEHYIKENKIPEINTRNFSDRLTAKCGVFVTLNKNNVLRGCIGRFITEDPLYKVVQEIAIASATEDHRFSKVTPDEIDKLEIEISVLSPLKKINSIDEIEMGKHGIYIKKGHISGTFLPQVAIETGWTKEEFLGHCARDKARLGWDGWKDAEIFIYEATIFSEKDLLK